VLIVPPPALIAMNAARADRRARAAEEEQDHQAGQQQADPALVEQVLDRLADEDGLVEDDVRHELLRDVGEARDRLLDAVDDRDRVGVASLFEDGQVDRALPVHADDVRLDRVGVGRVTHVANQDRGAPDGLQRQAVDLVGRGELAVRVEVVVGRADLHVAGGEDQVAVVDGADDVHDGQLVGLELQRVDVDHDLPVLPAERLRHGRTGDAGHLVAHGVLSEVPELRLVQALALERDQADGQARGGSLRRFASARFEICESAAFGSDPGWK
jgi:hypothetical protein